MNKQEIIVRVIEQLRTELSSALLAANNAHKAAIDDQSVAETQYDTLAIEAGYLAQGQAKRVEEIQVAINTLEELTKQLSEQSLKSKVIQHTKVSIGSVVQLEQDIAKQHYFFIAPIAGGYRCQISTEQGINNITFITPQAPMGLALMGQRYDDEIQVTLGNKILEDFITTLY